MSARISHRPPAPEARRWMLEEGLAEHAVECARADPLLGLLVHRLREVQEGLDVPARLGRDERQGHDVLRAVPGRRDQGDGRAAEQPPRVVFVDRVSHARIVRERQAPGTLVKSRPKQGAPAVFAR